MNFLPEDIENYTNTFTRVEGELLQQLEHETYQKVLMPRMCSGQLQGQVMRMLSKMIQPKYVLEVGTYTGYSALCWVDGLADEPDAKVYTLDINEEIEDMVRGYIAKHPKGNHIEYIIGNAVEVIPSLDVPHWDSRPYNIFTLVAYW